jgi:hypothetical protein
MEAQVKKGALRAFLVLFAIVAAVSAGVACAPAVAAGGGAAGAAYFTSRGAKAVVKGTPDKLETTSEQVLSELAIPLTDQKTEKGGAHRELKGKKGELDVTVTIDQKDDRTSEVEVTARKNAVEWDKEYAESLLKDIIKRS